MLGMANLGEPDTNSS